MSLLLLFDRGVFVTLPAADGRSHAAAAASTRAVALQASEAGHSHAAAATSSASASAPMAKAGRSHATFVDVAPTAPIGIQAATTGHPRAAAASSSDSLTIAIPIAHGRSSAKPVSSAPGTIAVSFPHPRGRSAASFATIFQGFNLIMGAAGRSHARAASITSPAFPVTAAATKPPARARAAAGAGSVALVVSMTGRPRSAAASWASAAAVTAAGAGHHYVAVALIGPDITVRMTAPGRSLAAAAGYLTVAPVMFPIPMGGPSAKPASALITSIEPARIAITVYPMTVIAIDVGDGGSS
jgi:hypothetical protein